MLKCMIADDEKLIRETIAKIIDWDSLGLRLIGICKNGLEAFDMIMDENPDLSLVDIRMPGLSGLELIKRVHAFDPDLDFIILSGYSEFEYARSAMQYGVRHYLLKPCSPEEIIEAIRQTIAEHQRRIHLRDLESTSFLQRRLFCTVHELAVTLAAHPEQRTQIRDKLLTLLETYSELDFQSAIAVNFFTWLHHELPLRLSLSEQLSSIRNIRDFSQLRSLILMQFDSLPPASPSLNLLPKAFIRQCIEYTQEHYQDPCLTLKWIAENHLYMNVDYVSKQFLKQTGERYSAFLNRIRIEHSKELLQNQNISFYEIAQQVGYGNNPQYFSQVFKKITGQTPTAYVQSL